MQGSLGFKKETQVFGIFKDLQAFYSFIKIAQYRPFLIIKKTMTIKNAFEGKNKFDYVILSEF